MEVLNCGWESKVSKGKNLKQKNEAWEDVGLLGFHKENMHIGWWPGLLYSAVQEKKKKNFSMSLASSSCFWLPRATSFLW